MKVVAYNGDLKAKESNTSVLVGTFLYGALKAGATTEEVFLIDRIIKMIGMQGCGMDT